MRQDLPEVAHIDPATAAGALDEVLPLVPRFATTMLANHLPRHDRLNGNATKMFPQQGLKGAPFV